VRREQQCGALWPLCRCGVGRNPRRAGHADHRIPRQAGRARCPGNLQLSGSGLLADSLTDAVKSKLGIKRVRGDTFGYLQRSFFGCVSDVDRSEAREVGEKAVHYAISDKQDGSVSILRTGCYAVDYRLTDLAAVGCKTRSIPDSCIIAYG